MARSTMVKYITSGRMGFTVSDASREWELAVFISYRQIGGASYTVVLTEVDGVCYSTSRVVTYVDLLPSRVVNAVGWMCKHWDEMDRESIKQVVRRHFQK